MSYPTEEQLLKRILTKLEKHDKSLFTAFELNLLKSIIAKLLGS